MLIMLSKQKIVLGEGHSHSRRSPIGQKYIWCRLSHQYFCSVYQEDQNQEESAHALLTGCDLMLILLRLVCIW